MDEVIHAAIASVPAPPAGFDVRLDPELPPVNADAGAARAGLANVLENAAASPATSRWPSGRARRTTRCSCASPTTARGSRGADLERVFEPFHRHPDEDGAGSGLGLAIARGFLEANGGRIRAESLPGQGTSFVIQMPAWTPPRDTR